MEELPIDASLVRSVNAALLTWRQGDLALDETWFPHVGDGGVPITKMSQGLEPGTQFIMQETRGLAVVSQTCDIVRGCEYRPYLIVSPLVEPLDGTSLLEIERGYRPRYGYLPAAAKLNLVVDLDLTASVEKSLVMQWVRTPGWSIEAEARSFARALARKYERFPFPDDFSTLVSAFQKRVRDKHGKASPEGKLLRAISEIRVQATPSWDSEHVTLFFWFILNSRDGESDFVATQVETWMRLMPKSGRFKEIEAIAASLDDLTGRDLYESDILDLDHLSGQTAS